MSFAFNLPSNPDLSSNMLNMATIDSHRACDVEKYIFVEFIWLGLATQEGYLLSLIDGFLDDLNHPRQQRSVVLQF